MLCIKNFIIIIIIIIIPTQQAKSESEIIQTRETPKFSDTPVTVNGTMNTVA
jgi:hypothetical protein